jgi:hypothetical protein
VVQVQRFQIGLDPIVPGSDEFFRADSAPLASGGDGLIQSNDVVQTQRFQIGLDPLQNVSADIDNGSTWLASTRTVFSLMGDSLSELILRLITSKTHETALRGLRIEQAAVNYEEITVNILVDSLGDESGYGFTLNYDPALLADPRLAMGAAGGSGLCTTSYNRQIVCSVSYFTHESVGSSSGVIGEIPAGNEQVLATIKFRRLTGAELDRHSIDIIGVNATNDRAEALHFARRNWERL